MSEPLLMLIRYRDVHFFIDEPADSTEDYIVEVVGWVSDDGKFVRVESERTPDGPRAITRIPFANVVSRQTLGSYPSQLAVDGRAKV